MARGLPSLQPALPQPLSQQQFEGLPVQPAEHLMQGGHAGSPLPGESQGLRYLQPLVPAPLTDGIQAPASAQHGADGQAQYGPQRVPPAMPAARVRQPGHHFQQCQVSNPLSLLLPFLTPPNLHSPYSLITLPSPLSYLLSTPFHYMYRKTLASTTVADLSGAFYSGIVGHWLGGAVSTRTSTA